MVSPTLTFILPISEPYVPVSKLTMTTWLVSNLATNSIFPVIGVLKSNAVCTPPLIYQKSTLATDGGVTLAPEAT